MIVQQKKNDDEVWPKGKKMPEPKYHSYLIRLWQEHTGKKSDWRFMLINLTKNEQQGFASMERLVAFLKEQMDEISAADQMSRDETKIQNNPQDHE